MHFNIDHVRNFDPEIAKALDDEFGRQHFHLEMIASENFTSRAVMEAQGSVMTNKYAEGYPGKRYYGGCENADVVESLALSRVKQLFGAEYANVQPHSGTQANVATYMAFIKPGDTIMGLSLAHGGHLTHGSHVNFSGLFFNVVPYGVRQEDERIDYDQILDLAKKNKPKMIVSGATAYPRIIDFPKLREICDAVGALMMVDIAHIAGLVVAGEHPSPVPYADVVTSTTHKTMRGPRGGFILAKPQYGPQIDKAVFPGGQGGPLMHVIAAKAIAFKEALQPEFKTYQQQVVKNSKALAAALQAEGIRLVSGGTDNHLNLADLRSFKLTGKVAEKVLDEIGITVNKNAIPFDPEKPFVTSGVRIGTPAITTRGLKESEMKIIGKVIAGVLGSPEDPRAKQQASATVASICDRFPLYGIGAKRELTTSR